MSRKMLHLKISSLPIVAAMVFATPSSAQEAGPSASPAITLPPVETVQPVTPPPVVSTLPSANDRVAPQALAEVEAERTERTTARREARGTPIASRSVTRASDSIAQPVAEAVQPNAAPVVNVPSDPTPEPVVESPAGPVPTQATALPTDANDGTSDWLLGAGIAGAIGLAGLAFAMRRRRRPGDVTTATPVMAETAPVATPIVSPAPSVARPKVAAPAADPVFAVKQQPSAIRSSDPLFAARADHTQPLVDPLFAYRPEQTPVTDPLFSQKRSVPPVTDPMFANRPEYEGRGADRKMDQNRDEGFAEPSREPHLIH